GLCLGGEYGGAITYVAEHVSDERRGYYTGWLQTSPTLGIVVSLAVIIAARTYFGNAAFDAWAWRVPFLGAFLLVAIAGYIPAPAARDPDLPGDSCQGSNDQEPLEGSLPERQHQIRADRQHRCDWRRRGLVQRSVLGLVLLAAGIKGRSAHNGVHCWRGTADWNADIDPLRLAVRPYRAQAGDPGWLPARGGDLLSAVFVPRRHHTAGQHQLRHGRDRDRDPGLVRGHGLRTNRRFPGGVLPKPDSIHVGVGAVSHWQRLGRWLGAACHHRSLPGHWQRRVRAALSDLGACGVLRAQPIPDAG